MFQIVIFAHCCGLSSGTEYYLLTKFDVCTTYSLVCFISFNKENKRGGGTFIKLKASVYRPSKAHKKDTRSGRIRV